MQSLSLASILFFVLGSHAFSTVSNIAVTFYGWPDNDPAGASIAYDCGRGFTAGGTGSFEDPLTMATAPGEFEKCEIVYHPYTEKYLRFEDTCAECIDDWKNGKRHIDIWTGSNTHGGGQNQIDCENRLTPSKAHNVVRYGSSTHAVNTGALYNPNTQTCHSENVYPDNN